MIFNSLVFVLFIACFFALWSFVKNHTTIRCCYILAASLFFYGWWNWYYLFVLILSGVIDFTAALLIEKSSSKRRKKLWLTLSMLTNLGLLGTFKYSEFIVENINSFLHFLGYTGADLAVNLPDFFLVLPIGISFYTFQSMSYTIDVYKGELKPTKNILHFFTYLTLFPQLVAGPIERAPNLLPQITQTPKTLTEEERFRALCLIIWGYFKKMVIADNLAYVVDGAFSSIAASCALWWWVVVLGFAFQIYCDFSGYTDIARGLARWMGLHLMKNFNTPYFSTDIREFWSRWHISLSSWFRDYVYIPLGGSRNGTWRTYRNLWITLGLSGLWHGAAWTFVCWGLIHALFLSIERLFGICTALKKKGFFGVTVAWMLTSVQILVAWVFFRSRSLSQALEVLKTMFSLNLTGGVPFGEFFRWSFTGVVGMSIRRIYFTLFVCWCLWLAEACWLLCKKKNLNLVGKMRISPLAQAVFMGIFLFLCVFLRSPGKQFIYFQF